MRRRAAFLPLQAWHRSRFGHDHGLGIVCPMMRPEVRAPGEAFAPPHHGSHSSSGALLAEAGLRYSSASNTKLFMSRARIVRINPMAGNKIVTFRSHG